MPKNDNFVTLTKIGRILLPIVLTTLNLLLLLPVSGDSQTADNMPVVPTIDGATQEEIIDSIATTLRDYYVFPETAAKMEQFVRTQLKNKAYADLTNLDEFARQLTEDLRSISHDRHLGVRFDPSIADIDPTREPTDEEIAQRRKERLAESAHINFGFHELKRLDGNIGYLDLRGFSPAEFGGKTAIAAMQFLSNSDAIIIDLRQNGGGSPSMIQLISSYFFAEPTHLNSFYVRETDSIEQFWTQAFVEGQRMIETPLYVLTSDYTFSAAEEFTYNMKNLKRATIVGDTTGGGAHPVDEHIFPSLLVSARIPFGRAINPISGTNWEGTGVTPDIDCAADSALDVAYRTAVQHLVDSADEPDPELIWMAVGFKAQENPWTPTEAQKIEYAGQYGPRTISVEGDALVYAREGTNRGAMTMIPLAKDLFGFDEIDWFRLSFERDDQGKVVAVVGLYQSGQRDRNARAD